MKKYIILSNLLIFFQFVNAQNNTSSPYSTFGIGLENKTATAGLTGLGNSGLAHKQENEINIFNSSNLGNIKEKSFLFDVGVNGITSSFKGDETSQRTNDFNISHLVIAFPLKEKAGLSLGILPQTKVGYDIDILNQVQGSNDQFFTRTSGSGGINRAFVSGGVNLFKNFNIGGEINYLFGNIEEETTVFTPTIVRIRDENFYNGFQFGVGAQYSLPNLAGKNITLGANVKFPTTLQGEQTRNSEKEFTNVFIAPLDVNVTNELEDFELPLSIGFGINAKLNKKLSTNLDYTRVFWEDTDQQNNNEQYVNQNTVAFGLEFDPSGFKSYWDNVKYRFGANYSTGYLKISDENINSYFLSAGVGLPLKDPRNRINVSYSFGQEGTLANDLVRETFHKLTLNINFVGNWFYKRIYN